ncbi:hypothetical protein [Alicyclobacillus sp.]|uniref:hypothetical protein n=1 Tax=Alicyclobacillus sp. TaxID=61169 RepID=UPI0025C06399|nr:hypothetical protein [Alicyclobacillus sp.]MCL6516278.1 hypothetical protein [Alicyclobacillus sp.]
MAPMGKAKMAALVGAAAGFLTGAGIFGVYAFADSTNAGTGTAASAAASGSTGGGAGSDATGQAHEPMGHRGGGPEGRILGQVMPQLANYFGITEDELHQELASGKSLNDVATAHGKTADALQTELKTLVHDALQQDVQAGRLTASQEATLEQKLDAQLSTWASSTHLPFGGPRGQKGMFGVDLLQLAAKDLNITVAELRKDLANGQSIADVAKTKGVDINQLTSDLEKAVTDKVNQNIQNFVNHKGGFEKDRGTGASAPASGAGAASPGAAGSSSGSAAGGVTPTSVQSNA